MAFIDDWNLGKHVITYISDDAEIEKYNIKEPEFRYFAWFDGEDTLVIYHCGLVKTFRTNRNGFDEVENGDIISVQEDGGISLLYSHDDEIDIVVTNKCNSNCIMCPLPEAYRRQKANDRKSWLFEYIESLPDDLSYINITGGEPTYPKQLFFELMNKLKRKFLHSDFQLLTNGRSLADDAFVEKVINASPRGIRFAIPVHSSVEDTHDMITRSPGSFRQTDRGIKNLLNAGQKVEIRIVISQKNKCDLSETANYIVENYKGVFCVNFIGMEMMGNAALNRDELWIDYSEAFLRAKEAILLLARRGIDVQLYNFPLCAVERGFWHIAAKSITGYKVRYMEECNECSVCDICGGFFMSTKSVIQPTVSPIRKNED